jgi:hypothetical protein
MVDIKKWLQIKAGMLALSFSNVEKNAFGQAGDGLSDSPNQVRKHSQGQLADSLINGEITQEVIDLRHRTYKILTAAEGLRTTITGYDNDGVAITTTTKSNNSKQIDRVKQDPFDDYPLEMVIYNNKIAISSSEAMSNEGISLYDKSVINYDADGKILSASHGEIKSTEYSATHKEIAPLMLSYDTLPLFELETFTKRLHIRKINETERLLEFYVSAYPDEYFRTSRFFISEIKKTIENPRRLGITSVNNVMFVSNKDLGTRDFLAYEYDVDGFDKIVSFDGNYVIKFKATIVVNGSDIFEKYKSDSLDERYAKKEKK